MILLLTQSKFRNLAKEKIANGGDRKFQTLVLDVVTRWDSSLSLLEHVLYFDEEIRRLIKDPELDLPNACCFQSDKFDLARLMAEILLKF